MFTCRANASPARTAATAATAASGSPSARCTYALTLHHPAPGPSAGRAARTPPRSPRRSSALSCHWRAMSATKCGERSSLASRSRLTERGERVAPPALRHQEQALRLVQAHARRELGRVREDLGRSLEPFLTLGEAAAVDHHRREVHVDRTDHRVRRPADPFGDRDRGSQALLGEVEALGQVRHHPERAEAADLHERSPGALGQRQPRGQVPFGIGEAERPRLADAQVHQREGRQLGGGATVGMQPRARVVDDGGDVADPARPEQLDRGERRLRSIAALRRKRRHRGLGRGEQRVGLAPARLRQARRRRDRGALGVAFNHVAREPANNEASVLSSPSRTKRTQWRPSSSTACSQSCASSAWRMASTTWPCSANQPAASRCSPGISSDASRRSSSRSRSASRWW